MLGLASARDDALGDNSNTGKEPGPPGDHVEQSCCHPLPSEPLQDRKFCL